MVLCAIVLQLLYIFTKQTDAQLSGKYISGRDECIPCALKFLTDADVKIGVMKNKISIANWNYESNLTEANKLKMMAVQQESADFDKQMWKAATKFSWKQLKNVNETAYRQFLQLSVLGTSALPDDKFKELKEIIADMVSTYSTAKVCRYNATPGQPCNMGIEPEIVETFTASRNYDELVSIWKQWRDATGKKVKDKYNRYASLSNEAAVLNGFSDAGGLWRNAYESETFQKDIEELWQNLKPLYHQLHAYVRRKLIQYYGRTEILPNGPIPAHVLGNPWAQTWSNILDIVKPFPNKPTVDITHALTKQKYTPLKLFKTSEEFFTSIGLKNMTRQFWERSIIEKPKDVDLVCHASAWDFFDGKDFRIKMCTRVNMEDFVTVHHEMGHIQYYEQYAHQPQVLREGANPGFHEAVGDTIALSVFTAAHLKKIGLIEKDKFDNETELNILMQVALQKIAFLPFGYLIDKWRWNVFSGEFKPEEYNQKWWEMRLEYQGLCPPVERTNQDLDAAAKYHVVSDVPYVRYFVSFVVQFQFYKSLCDEAGHVGPLYQCDFYQNRKAGKLFGDMLSLGSSVSWNEAMKAVTKGKSDKMDVGPLMEYFDPLMKWLKEQNKNEFIGWKNDNPMMCPENPKTA